MQDFCMVKHAWCLCHEHFPGYGEAIGYHSKLEEFRAELAREVDQADKPRHDRSAAQ